ncbi:MAG: hypothetical protein WCZ98_06535 [Sideroxydans sp.]|jgi:hypothetical protein
MRKFLRQTAYFLMLTLMSNALGWTFNQDAVADVWFDEQRILSTNVDHPADQHEDTNAGTHQHTCNHWCHAVGHFMGLPSQATFTVADLACEHSTLLQSTLQPHSPDELFRPPRATLA